MTPAAAVETPVTTPAAATKAEAERQARAVIGGVIGIAIVSVGPCIIDRRRRVIAVVITIITRTVIGGLAAILMHAVIIGAPIIGLDVARRVAGIVGADGVIASPQEAAAIRALPSAAGKLIVTPGVRPAGAAAGDQKRIATPAQALADGADHLVIGRPIWAAPDPRAAAHAILSEMGLRFSIVDEPAVL